MTHPHDLVIHAPSALIEGRFRPAEIAVDSGVIVAIGDGPFDAHARVELGADEVLIPGLVDSHVHVNEPGRTEWEGFASATRAAAAGGVTTIIDMPLNSIPATITIEALATIRGVALPQVSVDTGFWGGAVPENLGSLRELHEGGVFGFKAFLAPSGVDEFGHLDAAQLEHALAEIAELGSLLIVHAEDPGVLDAHGNDGGRDYHRFVESRPDAAELAAIQNVIDAVRRTGARAHILHLSSAAALPALRSARAEGLPITVETCPHYLTIAEEEVPEGGTQFKCCPPIRNAANRDALWDALVGGDIDIVVTDHSPATADLKYRGEGDFAQAWGGIAGLQVGLAAVWTEAARRGIPLTTIIDRMSRGPADLVGLAQKGRIAVGADADLVAFAPDAEFTVRATQLHHKNPVSAYEGRTLRGVVRGTWLRGQRVDTGADAVPQGRLLTQ